MTARQVLIYPHPKLRQKAAKVEKIDENIHRIINDMIDTVRAEDGGGLAAVQIGEMVQIFVMNHPSQPESPLIFINPEIIETRDLSTEYEGCLSFPGIGAEVERPVWVKVRALDRDGNEFEFESDGYYGKCLHHETEHLNGIVYVDHVSKLKRERLLKKMERYIKLQGIKKM